MRRILAGLGLVGAAAGASAQSITIDRAAYLDRLHGMWLGESIADWTGLQTEGGWNQPPFLTDAAWGTNLPGRNWPLDFITDFDPWSADDNTDVEYVYLHLMTQAGSVRLTAPQIAAGWLLHMNPAFIWVSNHRAWELMGSGVLPPMTGAQVCNSLSLRIDAQLTTEFFGALAPGRPDLALQLADLPIRTTATGFAAHAAQFYVVLHALTPLVDPSAMPRDQVVWLAREARRWLPDTSKSADIVDFVLADFLSNPDPNDWERTRDRVYDRYQLNAASHGFVYQDWTESSVNFAAGVIALVYGQGDYRRTLQIGTLGGWDSDDQAATMGAVVGMLIGYEGVRAQFPGRAISDRYHISESRMNLPDYLPADPQAEDTFLMMSQRMLPLIDQAVAQAGGRVETDRWIVPLRSYASPWTGNPMFAGEVQSANWSLHAAGAPVVCTASRLGWPPGAPWVYGVREPENFGNGYEADGAGRDGDQAARYFFSSQGGGGMWGEVQTLSVEYGRPVQATAVRFIEGDHWPGVGGWFESAQVQVKLNGTWTPVLGDPSNPLDPARPFQILDWKLPRPMTITGVRISGPAGGGFVTCCELDAINGLAPALPFRAVPR